MLNARLRRVPWVLWLHDILPDGAAATGLVDDGQVLRAARALERVAYREADRIVVLSKAFTRNLEAKGVPSDKIELIYDPATRVPQANRSNGHASNGHASNGHASNGHASNGYASNGHASNGHASNGNGSNGNGRNGHHPTTLLSMGNIGF